MVHMTLMIGAEMLDYKKTRAVIIIKLYNEKH